jgi:hypothetical protein
MLIIRISILRTGSAEVDWNLHCPCSYLSSITPAFDIPCGYFPTGFLIRIPCVFIVFSSIDTCQTHRTNFEFSIVRFGRDFMIPRIIAEYYPTRINISLQSRVKQIHY